MTREDALSLRSLLFVPALSEAFVEKAHTRGADAIIVDLEDSIAPEAKQAARTALAGVVARIASHGLPVFVRVNNEPALLAADLDAACAAGGSGVILPKAEDVAQVCSVTGTLHAAELARSRPVGSVALALLLESPLALLHAPGLASCDPRVVALAFGSEDYATAMGVRSSLEAMRFPAQMLAIAARAHGLAAWGLAGSIAEFSDLELFRRMAAAARESGFTGSLTVHPKQVAVVNEVFGVSDAEADEAREIVAAFDEALAQGRGAVAHEGRMLDAPVVARARLLLARARRG
jgi:citrate lyase subunit beta/citryl-CoA lyase